MITSSLAGSLAGRWNIARFACLLLLVSACAGCGDGSRYARGRFDGRRGYDGRGDYGYDLAASRAEARGYRSRAARSYPAPGPADDPWGPYIRQAAGRYDVPERWIREVMRQESGGRLLAADGTLTTSGAGAMGLMQVMPETYDTLRLSQGLGDDPYEPRDNILAGAAYIREMFDRFGAPGFLAAYNAGPNRLDAYLAGDGDLPDETIRYLSSVAPRLGNDVVMTGPLTVFAGVSGATQVRGAASAETPDEDRAFDGGGLVTPEAPTGRLTGQAARRIQARDDGRDDTGDDTRDDTGQNTGHGAGQDTDSRHVTAIALQVPVPVAGVWGIQVGAFPNPASSRAAITAAMAHAGLSLAGSQPVIVPVQREAKLYRARLVGLSADHAQAACSMLQRDGMACFTVPPGL